MLICVKCATECESGLFCPKCGGDMKKKELKVKKAAEPELKCPGCGFVPKSPCKFCPECGSAFTEQKPAEPEKIICIKCGCLLEAGAKFCPECGTKTDGDLPAETQTAEPNPNQCPQCGSKTNEQGWKFCHACGFRKEAEGMQDNVIEEQTPPEEKSVQEKQASEAGDESKELTEDEIIGLETDKLTELADKGNPIAQYKLGYRYFDGDDIPEDLEKAFGYFMKSAEQGNADAQTMLGRCYLNGYGIDENPAEAFKWFLKSAEQGNARGQYGVAWCYRLGDGVQEDCNRAMEWYMKAAEQGYISAQHQIGEMFYFGEGVEENNLKAFEWYSKAAEQGKSESQARLGEIFYKGQGINEDHEKAYNWFLKAAEAEEPGAFFGLGQMFFAGQHVSPNLQKAFGYFEKAVAKNHSHSHIYAALFYFLGSEEIRQDFDKAEELLMRCCEIGDISPTNVIREFVSLCAILLEDESCFYTPDNIPEKKFANASERFLKDLIKENDELLLFFDSTLLGSAKEGFALSPYRIYWSGYGNTSWAGLAWEGLSKLSLGEYSLSIEDDDMIEIIQTDMKEEIYNLLRILHNIAKLDT